MFIHLLAGSLVFLILGEAFEIEVGRMYLLIGAFWGIFPDPISYILSRTVKFNKWSHIHRDNISHSLLLPIAVLFIVVLYDSRIAIMIGVAMLTHPLLDLFGIGWGVKLFYPFSNKTYKMFYRGRILTVWSQEEVDSEAEKFGDDNWIRNIYFKPNFIGILDWLSLAGFLLLIVMH